MIFDNLSHKSPDVTPDHASQLSADMWAGRPPAIKVDALTGGSLEPGSGPSTTGGSIEPPPTANTVNEGGKGGNADVTANPSAQANGGNFKQTFAIASNAPSLGGGLCEVGGSIGVLFASGGFEAPSMKCIYALTDAQKHGQNVDGITQTGLAAIFGLTSAQDTLELAKEAADKGQRGLADALLQIANMKGGISTGLATDSAALAKQTLGPAAGSGDPTMFSADVLNDGLPTAPIVTAPVEVTPPPAQKPAPKPVHNLNHPTGVKKTVADCKN